MSRRFLGVLSCLWMVAACSSAPPVGNPDAGGFFRCAADPDCDDGQACTLDGCGVDQVCSFTPIDARCGEGETCVPGRGCQAGTVCTSNAECDDTVACTVDSCGVGGLCRHMALNELCTAPGVTTCDPTMGCVAGTGCAADADCDDGVACSVDACSAERACTHTAIDRLCTGAGERCSATMGCYVPRACTAAAECQDGNFCNGAEVCMPEFGCAPAESPRVCNDSEDCTVDACDAAADMCVFRCDPSRGAACAAMCPAPTAACTGTFRLTGGATTAGCSLSLCSSADFATVTFENADGVLSVRAGSYRTTPMPPGGLVLSDTTDPVCPEFDASISVSGGCTENYRLRGAFTDDDHFSGTLEWSYVDSDGTCDICGCTPGSSMVTGTRVP